MAVTDKERLGNEVEIIESVRSYADWMYGEGVRLEYYEPINQESDSYQQLLKDLREQEVVGDTPFIDMERSMSGNLGMMVAFQVVNYSYKDPVAGTEYWNRKRDRPMRGSLGLFWAMADSGLDWDRTTALKSLSEGQWLELTGVGVDNPLFECDVRRRKLNRLGGFVLSRGFGQVGDWLRTTGFKAERLLSEITETGLFEDRLFKRGQLLTRALSSILVSFGEVGVEGVDRLTVMGDSRIPQLLYNRSVLKISDEVRGRLNAREVLEGDDPLVDSLRSTAVVVGKYIADDLEITEPEADSRLWWLAKQMKDAGQFDIDQMVTDRDKF